MRKRIGVMVPSTNTTCEADFNMVVPRGSPSTASGCG